MLSLYTKYLLEFKKVCIPGIGTFEIIQHTPELNIADKILVPPSYRTEYYVKESLSDHQLDFFAFSRNCEKQKLLEDLNQFGKMFKNHLNRGTFQWNGLGTLEYNSESIIFAPVTIHLASLQPVLAVKVTRSYSDHHILVGDREMTQVQVKDALGKKEVKRKSSILIGWILLFVCVILIFYFLYRGGFQPSATGLRTNVSE